MPYKDVNKAKECHRIYYLKNRDLIIERGKLRYEAKKEEILDKEKFHYQKNKKRILLRNKKWRETHKKEVAETAKKYYLENIEKIKKYKSEWGKSWRLKHKSKEVVVKGPKKGNIPWNKGKTGLQKHTEEWKQKMSLIAKKNGNRPPIMCGENHPMWRGGVTPRNARIRASKEYCDWRQEIFMRDNFTCILCGQKGGNLNADHYPNMFVEILYQHNIQSLEDALSCDELWDTKNGRTLCVLCHKMIHQQGRIFETPKLSITVERT